MLTHCERPLISVAMGVCYKSDDTAQLQRAVESMLNQTYTNLELLIEDEGSSGLAMRWLEELAQRDNRVKLLRDCGAIALPNKLNVCLQAAQGRYIARMDDDDVSHPTRLEKELSFLQENPDISFVGCQVNCVCDGKIVRIRTLPATPGVHDFYMTQPYIHPTLLFRRDALEAANGYCEERRANKCEDYDLLLRLYGLGYSGANLPEILLDYTVRADAHDGRTMRDRWHETQTRYARFRELHQFPAALPYVVKPLVVGLLPEALLSYLKRHKTRGADNGETGTSEKTKR